MTKPTYGLIAVIAVLILVLIFKHSPVKQITKDIALQRSYDSSKSVIADLHKKISSDSLFVINLNIADSHLNVQYLRLKERITQVGKSPNIPDEKIATYNCTEIDSAFTARYKKDTVKSECTVSLTKQVGQHALIDLNLLDTFRFAIVPAYIAADSISRLQLVNKDTTIAIKDRQLEDFNRIEANYNNQDWVLKTQNKELASNLKKQKAKTVVSQIAFVATLVFMIIKVL